MKQVQLFNGSAVAGEEAGISTIKTMKTNPYVNQVKYAPTPFQPNSTGDPR